MRMRFLLTATTLSLALGGVVGTSGCDDLTAGTLQDDPKNPRVVRVMFQDDAPFFGRGVATDLYDKLTGQSCSDTTPCPAPQVCGELNGKVFDDKKCHNPNSVKEVLPPVGNPTGLAGSQVGLQIRVVLNKIIDPTIETVVTATCSLSKMPCAAATAATDCPPVAADTCVSGMCKTGKTACTTAADCAPLADSCVALAANRYVYKLATGTILLNGPDGKEIPSATYWDPTGSPQLTSDPIINPYGPALVIKPKQSLTPTTKYTIVINASTVKDRKGQALADPNGTPYGASANIEFTMESLFVMQDWNCPSGNCVGGLNGALANINYPMYEGDAVPPDDILQFTTNADIDETTADMVELAGPGGAVLKNCTVSDAGKPCIVVQNDRGAYSKQATYFVASCDANQSGRSIDVIALPDNSRTNLKSCLKNDDCANKVCIKAKKDVAGGTPGTGVCQIERYSLPAGDYTLTVKGVTSLDDSNVSIDEFTAKFTVKADAESLYPSDPSSALVEVPGDSATKPKWPSECRGMPAAPTGPDGGKPADGGTNG